MMRQILSLLACVLLLVACKAKETLPNANDAEVRAKQTMKTYLVSYDPTIGTDALDAYLKEKGYTVRFRYSSTAMLSIDVPATQSQAEVENALKKVKGVQRIQVARQRYTQENRQ